MNDRLISTLPFLTMRIGTRADSIFDNVYSSPNASLIPSYNKLSSVRFFLLPPSPSSSPSTCSSSTMSGTTTTSSSYPGRLITTSMSLLVVGNPLTNEPYTDPSTLNKLLMTWLTFPNSNKSESKYSCGGVFDAMIFSKSSSTVFALLTPKLAAISFPPGDSWIPIASMRFLAMNGTERRSQKYRISRPIMASPHQIFPMLKIRTCSMILQNDNLIRSSASIAFRSTRRNRVTIVANKNGFIA